MQVSIYQIDNMIIGEKALRAKMLKNVLYREAVKLCGGKIDPGIYIKVFSGDIDCSSIGEIPAIVRQKKIKGFRGHEIEVSDIIGVTTTAENQFFYVDVKNILQIHDFDSEKVGIHFTAQQKDVSEDADIGKCPICKSVPAIQEIKLQGYNFNGFLRYEVSCQCGMKISFPGCDTVNNKSHARDRCIELWNVLVGSTPA